MCHRCEILGRELGDQYFVMFPYERSGYKLLGFLRKTTLSPLLCMPFYGYEISTADNSSLFFYGLIALRANGLKYKQVQR